MEKFTVDLDKVLDDFEDAEEENGNNISNESNSNTSQFQVVLDNQPKDVVLNQQNYSHDSHQEVITTTTENASHFPSENNDQTDHDKQAEPSKNNNCSISSSITEAAKAGSEYVVNEGNEATAQPSHVVKNDIGEDTAMKISQISTSSNEISSPVSTYDDKSSAQPFEASTTDVHSVLKNAQTENQKINSAKEEPVLNNHSLIETMASMSVELDTKNSVPTEKMNAIYFNEVNNKGVDDDAHNILNDNDDDHQTHDLGVTNQSDIVNYDENTVIAGYGDAASATAAKVKSVDSNAIAVGFNSTKDIDVSDSEMDAYLSDVVIPEKSSAAAVTSENNGGIASLDTSRQLDSNKTGFGTVNNDVTDFSESSLPMNSPCPYSYPITTPIESLSKNTTAGLTLHSYSEECVISEKKMQNAVTTEGNVTSAELMCNSQEPICARPKAAATPSVGGARIPRPNSLLGLSKPILPNEMLCFVEKVSETEVASVSDIMNDTKDNVDANCSQTIVDNAYDTMQQVSPLRPPQSNRAVRPNSFPIASQPSPTNNKQKRPTSLNLMPRDFNCVNDKPQDLSDQSSCNDQAPTAISTQSQAEPTFDAEPTPDIDVMGVMTTTIPPNVGGPGTSPTVSNPPKIQGIVSQLGKVAPIWIPDSEAAFCMMCDARFTFTRRRHHCRACGKVFCSACCSMKIKLPYLDNKENRVCHMCHQSLTRTDESENSVNEDSQSQGQTISSSPNPNNPSEYCSTIPPLQQAQANANSPPPTVMVPVGVLKREGTVKRSEPKNVMFSDGIRPGGDLTELDGSSDVSIPVRKPGRSARKVEKTLPEGAASEGTTRTKTKKLLDNNRNMCLIPDSGLPPVVLSDRDFLMEEEPDPEKILPRLRSDDPNPVIFAINKNLFVLVKIINLDCCVGRICWCFTTRGMCTVGQDEIVIVLECLPEEKTIPRDIFCHLNTVYEEASKGNTVSDLGHTIFGQSFLGSRDHGGFLYIRPTFQCLKKLILPEPPYVFGILLQKWETPWAKVFPIRLMLRLGAEYRYYPCPLISIRYRNSIFGEIGHTIMNLLADFRDYQYMLPQIKGVVIHMEDKHTYIHLPRNRYEDVMKVINNSNDHVMALGTGFSIDADSHLVCIQNEEGNYQTQAINIQNKPRKVTGASFIVFNGALKASSGLSAKSSIVEDGLMVQIPGESMVALKQNLREMKDYQIACGNMDTNPDETVHVQWVEDDKNVNIGIKSPIDGMMMNGINSIHIHNATDYVGEKRTIRWTEVFFIQVEDSGNSRCEPVDLSRLAEMLAKAACIALVPRLDNLKESNIHKLGLRVTIAAEQVGYEIGANGDKLPSTYMNELDNELIPVIHNAASNNHDNPVTLELVFHILE